MASEEFTAILDQIKADAESRITPEKKSALDEQVKREAEEIANAPKVKLTGVQGRCHWCGRPSNSLVYIETVHGVDRYKGAECCGQRHL